MRLGCHRAWLTAAAFSAAVSGAFAAPRQATRTDPVCTVAARVRPLGYATEASGVAIGRRTPGRLWTHDDSGQQMLIALDRAGTAVGAVRLAGAVIADWEAVAVGPCPAGSCVYVGDIGDNTGRRRRISVYRFEEPASLGGTIQLADVFHATYPDGPHDAETLLVDANGRLMVITKGDTGVVALYRFPEKLQSGAVHRLERVGPPRGRPMPRDSERVMDGSLSANGRWVALRSNRLLTFHRASALVSGDWQPEATFDLNVVGEQQGEGVALADDGTVYLVGEGGGRGQPGTFARLSCPVAAAP